MAHNPGNVPPVPPVAPGGPALVGRLPPPIPLALAPAPNPPVVVRRPDGALANINNYEVVGGPNDRRPVVEVEWEQAADAAVQAARGRRNIVALGAPVRRPPGGIPVHVVEPPVPAPVVRPAVAPVAAGAVAAGPPQGGQPNQNRRDRRRNFAERNGHRQPRPPVVELVPRGGGVWAVEELPAPPAPAQVPNAVVPAPDAPAPGPAAVAPVAEDPGIRLLTRLRPIDCEALTAITADTYVGGDVRTSHPICAAVREIAEDWMLDQVRLLHPDTVIVDIGGNPIRHHRKGRLDILSLCPLIEDDPKDTWRARTREAYVRRHGDVLMVLPQKVEDFMLGRRDVVYVSVHSAYYLSNETIRGLVDITGRPVYAVVHQMPNAFGKVHGEGTYVVSNGPDGLNVSMSLEGDGTYSHRYLGWRDGYIVDTDDGSIRVKLLRAFGDTAVYGIEATRSTATSREVIMSQVDIANMSGAARMNRLVRHCTWTEYFLGVTEDATTVVGGYRRAGLHYECSIPISYEVLGRASAWALGKMRTPENFRLMQANVVQWYRRRTDDYQVLPAGLMPLMASRTAELAFTGTVSYEILTIERMVEDHGNAMDRLNTLATGRSFTSARSRRNRQLTMVTGILLALVLARRFMRAQAMDPDNEYIAESSWFVDFIAVALSALGILKRNIVVEHYDICEKERGRSMGAIRAGSKVKGDWDAVCVPKIALRSIGPHFNFIQPRIHRSCVHNALIAVANRQCRVVPECINKLTLEKMIAESTFRELVALPTHVRAMSPDQWLAGYTAKAKRLRLANTFVDEGDDGDQPLEWKDTVHSLFTKRECVLSYEWGQWVSKDPRLILAMSPKFQIMTGPWIKAMSNSLSELWYRCRTRSGGDVTYACGMNATALGHWFATCNGSYADPVYLENDFSRFDSTVNTTLLSLERAIYRACGCPPDVLRCLERQDDIRAENPKLGVMFSCRGSRASGDNNTSVGNSLINAYLHIMAMEHFKVQKYSMIFMGDDNLIILERGSASRVDLESLIEYFRGYGLASVPHLREHRLQAEFCSGRFWRVADSSEIVVSAGRSADNACKYVFGPKIGRILSKTFWRMSPFDPMVSDEEYLKAIVVSIRCTTSHIPLLRGVVTRLHDRLNSVKYKPHAVYEQYHTADRRYDAHEDEFIELAVACALSGLDVGATELRALETKMATEKVDLLDYYGGTLRRLVELDL
jgi:hypothetical protein